MIAPRHERESNRDSTSTRHPIQGVLSRKSVGLGLSSKQKQGASSNVGEFSHTLCPNPNCNPGHASDIVQSEDAQLPLSAGLLMPACQRVIR